MSTNEGTLWVARPAMFRNHPVGFLIALLLSLVGIGIPILLIWWLKCLQTSLTVTTHRTVLRRGLLSKSMSEVRHADVRNIQLQQSFFQRLFGTGTIGVSSSGQAGIEIVISGIPKPEEIVSLLRGLQERQQTAHVFVPIPAIPSGFAPSHAATTSPQVAASLVSSPFKSRPSPTAPREINWKLGLYIAGSTFLIALTWLFSSFLPWLAMLTSVTLIGLGVAYFFAPAVRLRAERLLRFDLDRAVWNGAYVGGVVLYGVLLFGLSFAGIRSARSVARERETIELANEQVAAQVKVAQGFLEKGDLDSAENELNKVPTITRATDTQSAELLRGKIQAERRDASARRANQEVSRIVEWAELSFTAGMPEQAESRLTQALAYPQATETTKARELLTKVYAVLAEKRRKLANEEVAKLVARASESFAAGDLDKSEKLVNEAVAVQNATDTQKATELMTTIRTAQAQRLIRTAAQHIAEKNYPEALRFVREYLAHPGNQNDPRVDKMARALEIVLEDSKADAAAKAMTDSQLGDFSSRKTLPADLAVDNTVITEVLREALAKHVSEEQSRRQTALQARMEQERRTKEEAEERRNKEEQDAEERRKHPRGLFGQPILTKAMYSQLREGMSYKEVKDIIGFDGEEMSNVELGGISTKLYIWKNMGGSNMNVTFQNGRLVMKAQFGL